MLTKLPDEKHMPLSLKNFSVYVFSAMFVDGYLTVLPNNEHCMVR